MYSIPFVGEPSGLVLAKKNSILAFDSAL